MGVLLSGGTDFAGGGLALGEEGSVFSVEGEEGFSDKFALRLVCL